MVRKGSGALVIRRRRPPSPVHLDRIGGKASGAFAGAGEHGVSAVSVRWIASTCIAALVGIGAIGLALYGALDMQRPEEMLASLEEIGNEAMRPKPSVSEQARAQRTALKKSALLEATVRGLATKHTIHDSLRLTRNGREFITIKPYARIVARLSSDAEATGAQIPALNPFLLYADRGPTGQAEGGDGRTQARAAAVKVLELVGGILPEEDGQELALHEVTALVAQAGAEDAIDSAEEGAADSANTGQEATAGLNGGDVSPLGPTPLPPRTTVLAKNVVDAEGGETQEGVESRIYRVAEGDSLVGLLRRSGAESWQARAMVEAAQAAVGEVKIAQGDEVHMTLVPSPVRDLALEPVRMSIFGRGQLHKVSVVREQSGEYKGSTAFAAPLLLSDSDGDGSAAGRATVYRSLYQVTQSQGLSHDAIMGILRTHAYDTDFRRRVSPGDAVEVFYDLEEDGQSAEGQPGEILFTSLTIGGQTNRFYRFRSPDGSIDFYDESGNSAKRFLLLRPVRGNDVRFTSGFGYRMHPIHRRRLMHTGVDWAAPPGTPILAAGNGIVEESGWKGGYGNYVRIRHANGYQTSYSHMSRIEGWVKKGVKVRIGQVIGAVGSTGSSTGPHLHYEVLVNNSHVDPMSIRVPRGRQLRGDLLAEFQRERRRIDDLMGRPPVRTRVAQASTQ
ncbi:MAG: peptidoglycan DD-metalloendopeptidase family protein [Rhizobiales bacterium]|nr:peptidoglycan DD-metalloendopeptidase family protein [Hyphomicrobiales bacterium]